MPNATSVTFVVAAWNDLDRLALTLEALVPLIEGLPVDILISDGGSTDGSLEYLASLNSPVLTVASAPDKGIYDAMNKGAAAARGDYLYFLNCGDRITSRTAWERSISRLSHELPSWAVARVMHHGLTPPREVPESSSFNKGKLWLGRQPYNHQGTIFRRSLFEALGGYDLTFGFMADLHLMLKCSTASAPVVIDETISSYEGGGISAPLVSLTPRILHRARCELLGLSGSLRQASAFYAFAQTVHRVGLRRSAQLWRTRETGFNNPWFAPETSL